ncbi:MAG: anhydro-N-acetylmuramic acid kinase, partial [Urechidicola sp.]
MKKNTYKAIGLMSGTSCDGIDMVYCSFHFDKQWSYKILTAKMVDYSPEWIRKLRNAIHLSEEELTQFDRELGTYFGKETKQFIEENNLTEIDFIASHGHTVFHKPEKGITVQIGSGKAIKEATQISVINDFRSLDVANGGQGAPLVPVGDKLLFSQYDYCLNI